MKTIVIYNSQTGFTRRYANWIAEAANAEVLPLAEAKKKDLSEYDAVVFGSWACAGSIKRLNWLKERMKDLSGKKVIVFCVGASPADNPDTKTAMEKTARDLGDENLPVFYCPGGLNYDAMSAASRMMMKAFAKVVASKKDKSEAEEVMAKMIAISYDISDPKYIEPILQEIPRS